MRPIWRNSWLGLKQNRMVLPFISHLKAPDAITTLLSSFVSIALPVFLLLQLVAAHRHEPAHVGLGLFGDLFQRLDLLIIRQAFGNLVHFGQLVGMMLQRT